MEELFVICIWEMIKQILKKKRILFLTWMKRKDILMTDELFFDTDCLSAFLWINNTNILQKLYSGRIKTRKIL